jgi:glycerol-3-phosphate dehydrogenase
MGIPSKYLSVDEALKIVPYLNRDAFVAATFCGIDGHLNPFKMTDAYMQAAKRLGVTFSFFEEVKEIMVIDHQVVGVKTERNLRDQHRGERRRGLQPRDRPPGRHRHPGLFRKPSNLAPNQSKRSKGRW